MRTTLSILYLFLAVFTFAKEPIISRYMADIYSLGGESTIEINDSNYTRIRMADSCYVEIVNYSDSILLVQTICAPICSSHASIYTKDWQWMHDVIPNTEGIFPLAIIENGVLRWEDQTHGILDKEERKKLQKQE